MAQPAAEELLWDAVFSVCADHSACQETAENLTDLIAHRLRREFSFKKRRLGTPSHIVVSQVLADLEKGLTPRQVREKHGLTKGQVSGIIFRNKGK